MTMPVWSGPLAVLGLVVTIVALVVAWIIRPRYLSWRAQRRRRQLLESLSVECLHDVAVADGAGGHLHVDYLLLTPRGVLVLDFWDVVGNVFGSDPMTHWTVTRAKHRHTFPNPQAALYDRLAALRVVLGAVPVEGRIVFADSALFPKGMPRFTLLESKLASEFFFGERHLAERAVDPWRSGWESLKSEIRPSIGPGRSL
jgi:hypothetical protein